MRIAISTQPLSSGHKTRGVGVYTRELIAALKRNNSVSICEFVSIGDIPQEVDLVHFTSFDPFFITLPFFLHKPFVVTVHDLIPIVFPEHFPAGVRGEVKWQIQKWNISRATRIITDSVSSKNDIIKILRRKDTVDVVPLAPPLTFSQSITNEATKRVIKKYALPKRFIVYVGDINWNKNILGLLNAWKLLKNKDMLKTGEKLFLVGDAFLNESQEAQRIDGVIKELQLESTVERVGRVSDDDLPALLSLSSTCVLASFYEGFGLPVLEAMSAGTVVIATHGGSLKEIAGPSLICDPNDTESIARKMLEAFSLSSNKREELILEGHAWANKFSWDRVAHETIAVYNTVINPSI
ncbi:MAG: glycosyltransferase family 1 protein [Patescibacteria group bacterium]